MPKAKVTDKMCVRCKEIKPSSEFYGNTGWADQNGCDLYCKACTKEMIVDKESARKYFWENNR